MKLKFICLTALLISLCIKAEEIVYENKMEKTIEISEVLATQPRRTVSRTVQVEPGQKRAEQFPMGALRIAVSNMPTSAKEITEATILKQLWTLRCPDLQLSVIPGESEDSFNVQFSCVE